MLNKEQINIISNYFKDKPVNKAYIFGSYIRNEENTNSDIDILVELDYSQQIGLRYIRMKNELQELLKNKVDLVSQNAISKYILPIVEKEKQLIYEK
jgi:predicted nucleotidyltransferase